MKIQPVNDAIVVEIAKKNEQTASGIILAESKTPDRVEEGTVIAKGNGKLLDDGTHARIPVNEGDTILFKKYPFFEVKLEDKEYIIVSTDDILAIINK